MRNTVLFLAVFVLASGTVLGAPLVDGRFNPLEGYTHGREIDIVDKGKVTAEGGCLWWYQDPVSMDVYAALNVPLGLNNNTYGANTVGFSKTHEFKSLVGSDSATIALRDTHNQVVFEFKMDYLSEIDKNQGIYRSLGVSGGDGSMKTGSSSDLLAFGTSLDYNLNTLGYNLTVDSPATDADFSPNPNFPGWEFGMTYEFQISGGAFAKGFGGFEVPELHNSPKGVNGDPRFGCSKCPPPPPPIPEPTTVLLLGLGVAGLFLYRRKRTPTA